jgi:hypothetical protein
MAEITTVEVKDYLLQCQGREITLPELRREMNIIPGSKSWEAIRTIMFRLAEQRIVAPTGKRNGTYKVISQVQAVRAFVPGREKRPPVQLMFPRDSNTGMEMDFANDVIVREGDLILISGLSNYGKTTLCLSFCAENIDAHPILMGNEYTTIVEDEYVPTPRFMNRLESMNHIQWVDEAGNDKFVLLPVRADYAEHIVRDRINIIDWINIDTGEHYMIGTVLEGIKRQLGRGVAIVALQKGEGAAAGRGGQFTKDFADLELLLDKFGDLGDVLMTIGKCKEATKSVTGKNYSYGIADNGTKIINFREVQKCYECKGSGFKAGKPCDVCNTHKWIDK